ncbi:hypothetical protein F5Y10DRAFT_279031 [Nemania abortiva]|nr:hypothetical protein F5Y10DRAFT_279031 [Nemania abortiva]
MGWFNEQIKQDTITQEARLLEGFVKLLRMQNHAEIEPFNLAQVDEVFNEWLEKDAIQEPAYRRRYLITQQDVHHIFAEKQRRFQYPGSLSIFEPQNGRREGHSLVLSREQGDGSMRTEKEKTNLLQDTDHETPPNTTRYSRSSSKVEIDRATKLEQSDCIANTDGILSQPSNAAKSQDNDADDVFLTEPPSDTRMSQKSTRAGYRGRKYKVHDDVSEFTTPPENYICRRCHEPGHWIQHCPTNLDPSYDQAPPHDYRCNFCGQYGDHFATLCPKNPHEGSLSKQRKYTVAITRGPRTPTEGGRRRYQGEERSATRSQGRYRSRSPEQHSRGHYRSRSPEHRRSYNIYGPPTRDEGDRRHSRRTDDSDASPYTKRARLTRELYVSSDTNQGGKSSPRSWDDSFHFERRLGTPSPSRRHSPVAKKPRQRRKDLDKVTDRADEGRLAYDDEIDTVVRPKPSQCSPTGHHPQHISVGSSDKEQEPKPALSSVVIDVDAEDLDEVEDKTDDFLRALAAEVMLKGEDTFQSMPVNNHKIDTWSDSGSAIDQIDDSICFGPTAESDWVAAQSNPSPKNRRVRCPPFSPKVVSLFNARENPIINARANRRTASQMMEKSEGFLARRIQQASEGAISHHLPHRLLNPRGEDSISVN